MTDPNYKRPGYKKTKVGWIPDEWECVDVGHTGVVRYGLTVNATRRESRTQQYYLGVAAFSERGIDLGCAKAIGVVPGDSEKYTLQHEDVLVIEGNGNPALVGKAYRWEACGQTLLHQNHILRVRPNEHIVDSQFLVNTMNSPCYRRYIRPRIISSSGLFTLNSTELSRSPIPLPPLIEQKRIARVLETWDRGIEKLERLTNSKRRLKKGLMQQLLAGKQRLPGFSGKWEKTAMGSLFRERCDVGHSSLELLSITARLGVVRASDLDRKDSSCPDRSKYKRICVGDIGYNTMRMWQGTSAVATMEGIVSPAYTVIIPKANVKGGFIRHLFKLKQTIHMFYRYSQGLTSDTWNLKFRHFKEVPTEIPALPEQRAIASVLDAADREIGVLEKQLAALREQKRGLMQKLLTGQVRVRMEDVA